MDLNEKFTKISPPIELRFDFKKQCLKISRKISSTLFFFSLFPFLSALQHMEFPTQGLDPSLSCCGNAESLTQSAGAGLKPVSWCWKDAADPVALQQELPSTSLFHLSPHLKCINCPICPSSLDSHLSNVHQGKCWSSCDEFISLI